MTEPKMFFDTEAELFDCLSKWQKRLGLSDWFIAARLCSESDMKLENAAGESEVQHVNMCGMISILRKEDLPNDLLLKQPHEEVLIHELLHFKFITLEPECREDVIYEEHQHQLIELLAKALFLAEYNLQPNWFIDDNHKYTDNLVQRLDRLGRLAGITKEAEVKWST